MRELYQRERRKDTANVTIYCSTPEITPRIAYHHVSPDVYLGPAVEGYGPDALRTQVLTGPEQRVTVKHMGAALQEMYREQSGLRDVVKWLPQCDAPRCDACGSLPPR